VFQSSHWAGMSAWLVPSPSPNSASTSVFLKTFDTSLIRSTLHSAQFLPNLTPERVFGHSASTSHFFATVTMGHDSLLVLYRAFLSLKGVALGRLVTDVKNPSQDFWPDANSPLQSDEYDQRPFDGVKNLLSKTGHLGLYTQIARLFSSGGTSEASQTRELTAPQSKVYSLLQPTLHFQRMCKEVGTREWMERTLKHYPIFLVVGLISVTDATVEQGRERSRKLSSSLDATPVTDFVAQGAAKMLTAVGIGGIGDAKVVASVDGKTRAVSSFTAPGERVIGVQYRKIKFRLFSSNKVDTSFLENNPNRWVMLFGGDRAGVDNILEAELEEAMDIDDLELGENGKVIVLEEGIALIDE
jgi:hypothetical protein